MGFNQPRPVGWRGWAKAHGTHNAPLFHAGEGGHPRLEKENICDWLSVGNRGLLMLVCSNVCIIREFSGFLMSHLMRLFRILLRLKVCIKGLQGVRIPLCHWSLLVFQQGGLVRHC